MLGTEFSNEINTTKANQLCQTFVSLPMKCILLFGVVKRVLSFLFLLFCYTTCKVEELRNPFIFYSHSNTMHVAMREMMVFFSVQNEKWCV